METKLVFQGSRKERLGKSNILNGEGGISAKVTLYAPDGTVDDKIMYYYRLEIRTEESDLKEKLNSILGLKPNVLGDTFWVYEKESYLECDFISYSLSLLNGKYDELNDIGIDRSMITIWILYEYDNDIGSLYFSPEQLNGLGEEKINLCISCWDKCNPTFTIEDITVKDDMFNAFDIYTYSNSAYL